MAFKAFPYLYDTTMEATVDGVKLCTTASALTLRRFTPLPVWSPDDGGWIALECMDVEFRAVGTFEDVTMDSATRIGYHMPDAVTREIQDWCERYVQSQPDRPMIYRDELTHQQNAYRHFAARPFSFNALRNQHDADIEKHSRSLSAAAAGRNVAPGAGAARAGGPPDRQHAEGPEALAVAGGERQDSLFDEAGG